VTFRKLHRTNAIILGVFIAAHLINHIFILGGVETHITIMKSLRFFYRPVSVEVVVYVLFVSQILLGVMMMLKQGRPRNRWGWAQYISGAIVAIFLLQHLSAALMARLIGAGVDTNIYWAASVVSREPFVWYFAPYYALGIIGLFVHVAAALQKSARWKAKAKWIVASGVVIAAIVVPSLMGLYGQPINLPPEYVEYLNGLL
jgi:NADH:ubiquinone oxidoreductase subunit 6 (subunit J)